MLTNPRPKELQRGFSMVEVLVAIVIFAVGVLGLVGMQTASLRHQKTAWLRASTSMLVMDITERVRSNLAGAKEPGAYQLTKSYADLITNPPRAPVIESSTLPTQRQIAERDIAEWAAAVAEQLPGGEANLSGDIKGGFVATLMWRDKEFFGTSPQCAPDGAGTGPRHCCPHEVGTGIRCQRTTFTP
jgi:type IV pilus assembly protein PilV